MNRALLFLLSGFALISDAFSQNPDEPDAEVQFTKAGEIYTFSWLSRLGRTYFFQHSDDLVTWHYLPSVVVVGNGSRIDYCFSLSPSPERYFLRLKHIAGSPSDPLTADSDNDRVPNDIEFLLGTDTRPTTGPAWPSPCLL